MTNYFGARHYVPNRLGAAKSYPGFGTVASSFATVLINAGTHFRFANVAVQSRRHGAQAVFFYFMRSRR
jgi:hypothetical protein